MTSTFDFLMVLYSIIIGISIAEILTPIGHVIQGNRTVKLYWVHAGCGVLRSSFCSSDCRFRSRGGTGFRSW